jgi:hypothetical protein
MLTRRWARVCEGGGREEGSAEEHLHLPAPRHASAVCAPERSHPAALQGESGCRRHEARVRLQRWGAAGAMATAADQ